MKHFHYLGRMIWGAVFALAPFLLTAGAQAEEPTFRDLTRKYFKNGEGADLAKLIGFKQPIKKVIGLEYKVLLLKDGKETPVDPKTHEFKVGDRIRIEVQPLNDYYVYIFHIGASGKSCFLLPEKDEDPPLAKKGEQVALPGDGFLEFGEPAGEETLLVVATEKPVADRALFARVLSKKPGEEATDTPEERALRNELKATVRKALRSASERQQDVLDNSVTWRGLTSDKKSREQLEKEVEARNVKEGTFEEPTINSTGGTTAVYVGAKDVKRPKLLVTIPLKSATPPSSPSE
jgi:hypothetical protein